MQRQKSFTRHFFGLWGWLAAGTVAVGAVFVVLAVIGSRDAERLSSEGADATAIVTDRRRTSDSEGGTDYTVRYSFTVGDETIEDRQDVSFLFYQAHGEGDAVPVRYWIGDPTVSEIERGDAATMGWIGTICTVITAAVALVFARIAWKRAAHATWMARNGVRRQVTVTRHVQTNVSINDVAQWTAHWIEADGRDGATRMARHENLPPVGSQITILIDPEHRRDSIWQDDVLLPRDRARDDNITT
jgi:hypothetical protein